ncbi:MAG: ATP-binding protein [Christensenellaceae bacterium]
MIIDRVLYGFTELNTIIDGLIAEVRSEVCLDDEQEYKIRLVSNELLINIFKYAQASAVHMTAEYQNSQLKIAFTDDGKGFESETFIKRNVSKDDFLMCESGRGVFIVKMVADSLEYNERGNVVTVILKLI